MITEPTTPELDRTLLQLRISLANALTMVDVIRALRPKGNHLLPHLYAALETLMRVERRARAVLRHYVPPEGSTS